MTIYYARVASALGPVLLSAHKSTLIGLYFDGQKHIPDPVSCGWVHRPALEIFAQAEQQLAEYLAGTRKLFDIPCELIGGTDFQRGVWQQLKTIPYGELVSYKSVATAVGKVKGVRAVASAVGRNPLTLIIPCHRVVGSDGSLTGYAGGLERKKKILGIEGI